ncbi:ribonuclease T2 family protein [Halomonas caseinilytica]|uniref:Ribonuclease T2/ribonuclease I n=1 Tax=Halomonas caseinilytica TaxID=438744 RepID=A0A1M7A5B1_9GAMM|nr:ribonuclease I [Halomonas caseinilytica]SHL37830.1 ribonuclease T2/ribonuclease I [Halomonas caseinilytica]
MSLSPLKRADYYPRGRFWQVLLTILLLGMAWAGASQARAEVPSIEASGFDHYTLALTWHPGFCASRSRLPRECREPVLRRGTEAGFVLHGLWPSLPHRLSERGVERRRWWRQGCFIERPRPDGGFCRHPDLELSEGLAKDLGDVMPGRASCLGRYQYAKHAACLDVTAEDLFDTSVALVEAVNASAFTDFLVIHRGGEVARNALIEAFEGAFGPGTGRALRLECAGRGNRLLTEVRIGIDARSLAEFPDSGSLVRLGRGDCASRVRIATFD